MSSFLDISIERQSNGRWINFLNCSSDEDLETVNLYLLRDTFNDCDCYSAEASVNNVSKETALHFAEKISQKHNYFNTVLEGTHLWPYDKNKSTFCIDTETGLLNTVNKLWQDADTRYCTVRLYCINGKEVSYETPYAADQDLRYNPEYKDKNLDEIFEPGIIIDRYYYENGDEVLQYQVHPHTYISTYKDLNAFKEELLRELEQAKLSQEDDRRLSDLLRGETSSLKPEEMEGPLGDIVKRLIKNDDEWTSYSVEYIESLKNIIEELKFLIRLTGENGRIVWGIS